MQDLVLLEEAPDEEALGNEGQKPRPHPAHLHHPSLLGEEEAAPDPGPRKPEKGGEGLEALFGVVVAGDDQGRDPKGLELHEELHRASLGLRRNLGPVKQVPGDHHQVHPLGPDQAQKVPEGGGDLRGPVHPLEELAQVPVGGVEKAHGPI